MTDQATDYITISWSAPASNGGCDLEGYRLYIEDVNDPGDVLVYDGSLISSVTSKTVSSPYIEASQEYKFTLQAKNCGYFSDGATLTTYSASVPSKIENEAKVASYDSTTAMTVEWEDSPSNGGFAIENYLVYVDNNLQATLDASIN